MEQKFTFIINGYEVEAAYEEAFLAEVDQLIAHWSTLYEEKKRRILIFLAAPPAAGKSTLAALFEAKSLQQAHRVQALGMDGFHHYQSYILSHMIERGGKSVPMKAVKGCPETFDFNRFKSYLQKIAVQDGTWPLYDRSLHDVRDDQIQVTGDIVLIEGNYLLLDEAPWNTLQELCDEAMFVNADSEAVKARLIKRKMMGGMLPHEAIAFCEQSDLKNVERILAHRLPADIELELQGNRYCKKQK